MATFPSNQVAGTPPTETIEHCVFGRLEETWTRDVGHFSSPAVLMNHPAFQESLGLGLRWFP